MALDTVVDENKWKSQGGGSNPDGYSSTFQRKQSDGTYKTKLLEVTFLEVTEEFKHYALTKDACTNYIALHPELALTFSRQNEFGEGYTLIKRFASRSNYAFSLTDVAEEGA